MCKRLDSRWIQSAILLITGFVLFTSFYLQYTEALLPCPLCMMQRAMTVAIFVSVALSFLVKKPLGKRILLGFLSLFVLSGIIFALRQLYLESLPVPETGMCLPGIESLIQKLPWDEIIHAFVWGSKTGCGEVTWEFLGFSMAAWSLLYFISMAILLALCWIKALCDESV